MARPKDWVAKYGPWGTPPDYTPSFTGERETKATLDGQEADA
jgi:hypothetical protein